MKILGEIVLYNPELKRLKKNIFLVIKQVDFLYLYDNGSQNISEVEDFVRMCGYKDKILIVKSKKNHGVASALNRGMEYALANGYLWVLTLDQDSIFMKNGVNIFLKYVKENPNVAIFAPYVYDRNLRIGNKSSGNFKYLEETITSGALTSVQVWNMLHGYDEWLFIDEVDHEFSWRVVKSGYKIMQINEVCLLHEMGNCRFRYFFNRKFMVYNHSAFRKYFQVRNQIYLGHKYGKNILYKRVIRNIILTILYEKDKKNKLKEMYRGIIDAYRKIRKDEI